MGKVGIRVMGYPEINHITLAGGNDRVGHKEKPPIGFRINTLSEMEQNFILI